MMANQMEWSRLEERSVIKFFGGSEMQTIWNYSRIHNTYGKVCFNQKHVYKWDKLFKEGWNSIQDEGRPTIASTFEMVNSVNALIFADKRVTIEDISEQQNFCAEWFWFFLTVIRFHRDKARRVESISQFGWEELLYPPYSLWFTLVWTSQRISA